ncbi:MAG: hypothetical protein NZ959_08595, partial [Armatimonadetes bacterium]|nr:hypothetical protein [Armatimonadota bacterium]
MRTVGLTLVGQYLTQPPPQNAATVTLSRLNRAIAGIRCPHYSDWITLLNTLANVRDQLELNFFPEFPDAMEKVRKSRVAVPREYGLDSGARYENLNWLDAFLALRNGAAHSGMSRDAICQRDLVHFRPFLDDLLNAFEFLTRYDLLVLRSSLNEDAPKVQVLKGDQPPDPQPMELDDRLYLAFEFSPVVMRAPDGRLQGLFPLFHGHIEGEPLHCYDGHYLVEREGMHRRTIYYLGIGQRLPLDDEEASQLIRAPAPPDAGAKLLELLQARQVPWHIKREDVAPWTIRDFVNDYARRTLNDLIGIKYLPQCYLDRPALSQPLWRFASESDTLPQRVFLLSGRAGCGKTALLCDLVRRLLEEQKHHLVFFVRGDGLIRELEGSNLLLANLLHKIGLNPRDFLGFAEFFNLLEARMKEDRIPNRRFVIVLDALNEAPESLSIFREAMDMIQSAREHPWIRIILSVREEFLFVLRGRRGEGETNPFYTMWDLFVHPPEDPHRPRRPEDPPAWNVSPFTEEESKTVYRRYQQAKDQGEPVPACNTAWEQIPPATRREVLLVPLHLDLWMRAFDGREAPAISGVQDLFAHFLEDTRRRFDKLWESLQVILDFMLEKGRAELNDDDANEIEARWRSGRTEDELRLRFSPIEVACLSGLMQKRITEEGGGYRIPHQRLREELFYARLKEKDPHLRPESLRQWLALKPTEELVGALARVAEGLWEADRARELTTFLGQAEDEREWEMSRLSGSEEPLGVRALEQMLVRRLELREETNSFVRRLRDLLNRVAEDPPALHLRSLLLFDVSERVEGLAVTDQLRAMWETTLPWLQDLHSSHPQRTDLARDLSVCYTKLGDVYQSVGDTQKALEFYQKALEIDERLYQAEPYR